MTIRPANIASTPITDGVGWIVARSVQQQHVQRAEGCKSALLKLVVDSRILAVGMGFSLLMGCVGGLIPALSATRLKPLDSVR